MCKMLTFSPGIFFVLAHVSVISRFGNAVVSRNVQRLLCIFCSMVFVFCVCVVVFPVKFSERALKKAKHDTMVFQGQCSQSHSGLGALTRPSSHHVIIHCQPFCRGVYENLFTLPSSTARLACTLRPLLHHSFRSCRGGKEKEVPSTAQISL